MQTGERARPERVWRALPQAVRDDILARARAGEAYPDHEVSIAAVRWAHGVVVRAGRVVRGIVLLGHAVPYPGHDSHRGTAQRRDQGRPARPGRPIGVPLALAAHGIPFWRLPAATLGTDTITGSPSRS